ncbi:uncharacterized protein LOC135489102 isoform X2 [Lineus longissimus]|uniref:uncharacterized protein LOC135489102 isoform X2 n=1 Tax=Lineus longissimus TaxID=88925 RepID=UPI002B4E11AD
MQNANQGQQNWGQGYGGNMAGGAGTGGGTGSVAVPGTAPTGGQAMNPQASAQMYQQYAQAMAAYGQQQNFGNWSGQNMQGQGYGGGANTGGNFGWNQGGQWGNQGGMNQGQNQMWNQNQQGQGQGNFQGGNRGGMNQQGWGNNNMPMGNQGGGGGNANQRGQWGNIGNQNSGGNWGNQNQGRSPKQGGGNWNQMDGGGDDDDEWDNESMDGSVGQKRKHRGGQKLRNRRMLQDQRQQEKRGGGNKQVGSTNPNPNKRQRIAMGIENPNGISQGGNQGGNRNKWGKGGGGGGVGGKQKERGGGQWGQKQQKPPGLQHQANQWGEGSPADMQNIQNRITKIADRVTKKLAMANSDEDKFDFIEEFIKESAETRGEALFKFETILNKMKMMSTLVFLRDPNNSSVCRLYINDIYIAQGFGLNQTKSKGNCYAMSDDLFKERNWRSKLVCDEKLRQDTFLNDDVDITFISYPEEHKTLETTQFNCPQWVTSEWSGIVLLEKTGVFQGANGILKQSAEFNKMVLEYDYVEPEKSVCKCQVLIQNTCLGKAEKSKRNKAKSAASHEALKKIKETNWTIKIIRTEFPACGNIVRRKTPMVVQPIEEDSTKAKTEDDDEKKDGKIEPKLSLDDFLKMDGEEAKKEVTESTELAQTTMEEDEVNESGFTPPKANLTPSDVYTEEELNTRNTEFYAWAAPQTALDKLVTMIDAYKAKDSVDDLILSGFNVDERHHVLNYCKYIGLACAPKRWYDDVYLFISLILEPQVLLDRIMALGGKTDKYELVPPTGTEEPVVDDEMAEVQAAMAYVPEQTNGKASETDVKTAVETATETAVETAAETAVETAVETAAETAVETTAETAVETAAETAVETAAETAVETAAETAVEMAAETAVETAVETEEPKAAE